MSPETEGLLLSSLERWRTEYYNEADRERSNPHRAERLRSRGDALAAVIADIVANGAGSSGGGEELRGTVTNDPCAAISEPPTGTVRAPYGEIRDALDNNGRLPIHKDGGPRYWSGTAGDGDGFSEWRIHRRAGRSDEWIVCAGPHAVAWLRRELGKAGLTIG